MMIAPSHLLAFAKSSFVALARIIACAAAILILDPISIKAQDPQTLLKELSAIVQSQADSWNRGDIDAFMQAYWKSEELTFSSGGVTERGWEATRERYHKRYPDRAIMGKLTFSKLEVQSLGDRAALMLGRWELARDNPVGGNFSLVWRQFEGEWRIVHDHTSTTSERP